MLCVFRCFIAYVFVYFCQTILAADIIGFAQKPSDVNVQRYLQHANDGNASAQCSLAEAYQEGRGVKQNLEAAVHWFQLASEQNHTTAMFKLILKLKPQNSPRLRCYICIPFPDPDHEHHSYRRIQCTIIFDN